MRTLYIAAQPDPQLKNALRQAGHLLHELHPDEADWAIAESRHLLILYDAAEPDPARLQRWATLRPPHANLLVIAGEQFGRTAELLRAGADGCLRRPLSVIELEARVQALLRGTRRSFVNEPGPGDEPLRIGIHEHIVRYGDRQQGLAPREHALLLLLGRAVGRAISRDIIWQHLWGEEPEPRPERIDLYISRLRRKLVAVGAPNALESLRGFGYRLGGPVSLN